MPLVIADRVRETSTTVGTGTLTLDGAVASYQSFSAIGNGNTVYYTIVNQSANEWEVGIGTYTSSGTTLSRGTVLSSSNSGSLVNFSAGTKDVWGDYPAGKAVTTDTLAYPPAIGGTTPAAATFTTLTATGQTSLGGAAGSESLRVVTRASADRWLEVDGGSSATGGVYVTSSLGSLYLSSNGGQAIRFFTNGKSITEQFRVSHTASAVNYVQVTGNVTTSRPVISAQGSDSNIGLNLASKGNRSISLLTNSVTAFDVLAPASGVNYLTANGSITGITPSLVASGTDTNIAFLAQSKGTGAIDLAAGSSGVNISNGGTVTAITRTATGSGYTSIPSVVISAPTTAGGVQATATATVFVANVSVQSGGTGYTVGDVLTLVGGTFSSAATVTVATLSSGVITGVTMTSGGAGYSVIPTNPISVTGGTGTGATLNITSLGISSTFTITNAGSGYVEQPTVTFSGGGGSGAAAYATVGGTTTIKTVGVSALFNTPGGPAFSIYDTQRTTVDYWEAIGSTGTVGLRVAGASPNTSGSISSKGTGFLQFVTNNFGQEQLRVAHTASAVNYVQVTGAATGGAPYVLANGSDTNIPLILSSKGTGNIQFKTGGVAPTQFLVANTTSAVNYLQVTGAATGSDPVLSAQGADTNIDMVLQPKGTGALQAQLTDSATTGGNARGANAVDWQTWRSAANQVASGTASVISGGYGNTASVQYSTIAGGSGNAASGWTTFIGSGQGNSSSAYWGGVVLGYNNASGGYYNVVVGGSTNSTATGVTTTQSATMNATTTVTLSASNASIKVGQYITGTYIANQTYVAAISGTTLTLSQAANGSGTATLSFYTPHGVVVGGGNNQATGAYSFIGGGGDAGTAASRNTASGDWSVVGGGQQNTASGVGSVVCGGGAWAGSTTGNVASGGVSFVGGGGTNVASGAGSVVTGGWNNSANATYSSVVSGRSGTTRSIVGNTVMPASNIPIATNQGTSQAALLVLGKQTTDATATVLVSDSNAAGTTNQIILPNNAAYYFKGSVIANVTGAANGAAWEFSGAIMRGANAASTVLIDTPSVNRVAASSGATAWTVSVTADTTNGGLAVTVTGAAATTIRWVAKLETTEVTF